MSKPETLKPALSLCSDCAWPDACAEDDRCTRARLTLLGFDTGMNVATAFEILGETSMMTVDGGYSTMPPSAIIEPPTKAELQGELNAHGIFIDSAATADSFLRLLGAPIRGGLGYIGLVAGVTELKPGFYEVSAAPATPADVLGALMATCGSAPAPSWLRAARDHCNELVPYDALRAQIRTAIDEISKAQKQIVPAFEAECFLDAGPAKIEELERDIRTAASVLEALPEAVAQHFGLTIRGACAECGTTLFREEPYTSNAAGKPTCEAHADPEAA